MLTSVDYPGGKHRKPFFHYTNNDIFGMESIT